MGTASDHGLHRRGAGHVAARLRRDPRRHADRLVAAEETGRLAVELIGSGRSRPSQIITEQSVENAFRVLMAISGSTNAIVHLTAIAGRLGIRIRSSG